MTIIGSSDPFHIQFVQRISLVVCMNAENGDKTSRYDQQNPIPSPYRHSFHMGVKCLRALESSSDHIRK